MSSRSPILLALDTSSDESSVALRVGDATDVLAERAGSRHAERVLPMAESLLAARGLRPEAVDAIAFGAGPGAFTGLRVACGIAQGLGWALERPLVAVDSLEAIASRAADPGRPARVVVAIDARIGEVYAGLYAIDADGASHVLRAPWLASPRDAAAEFATLAAEPRDDRLPAWQGAGDAFTVHGEAFAAAAAALGRVDAAIAPRADAVARIGEARWRAGQAIPASEAAPAYVRDKVALDVDEQRALRARRDAAAPAAPAASRRATPG